MKNSVLAICTIFFVAFLILTSCSNEDPADPCNGLGVLNIENKLDSTISVEITETHSTESIKKDYTLPFSLAGNLPYTLTINGPSYHKDTTIMVLFCDNQLFIVK